MNITLESTSKLIEISVLDRSTVPARDRGTVPARIWEGHTESGIPVHCYITRIAAPAAYDQNEFLRELQEHRAPSAEIAAIPLRMIL